MGKFARAADTLTASLHWLNFWKNAGLSFYIYVSKAHERSHNVSLSTMDQERSKAKILVRQTIPRSLLKFHPSCALDWRHPS